jgi:hypothetical protein
LSQTVKGVGERRWRLWREGHPVRIAPDLADTLRRLRAYASGIKRLSDLEKIPATAWKPANFPRGDLLRMIFRDLSDNELRSLTTLVICLFLGIKLQLFDERKPHPLQVLKRALGLPKDWEMPPGFFDVIPYAHEQMINALSTATTDELEVAKAACRFLSRHLDDPENWRRGAIEVCGATLPWRPIKLAGLLWQSPIVRAATVGLIILGLRYFKGEEGAVALASMASQLKITWPKFA